MEKGFASCGKVGRTAIIKSFCALKQILSSFVSGNAAFYSGHRIVVSCQLSVVSSSLQTTIF